MVGVRTEFSRVWPGLLASFVIAAAAAFLADHYSGPVMLFALLLGMAMNFLSEVDRCKPSLASGLRSAKWLPSAGSRSRWSWPS